jgi:hypothetical protein
MLRCRGGGEGASRYIRNRLFRCHQPQSEYRDEADPASILLMLIRIELYIECIPVDYSRWPFRANLKGCDFS